MIRCCLLLVLACLCAAADPWPELARIAALPPADARKALEAMLLDRPGFHAARFNLGTLLLDSDTAAAEGHLRAATGAPQARLAADAWHNLALALLKLGRLEECVAAAGEAARLDPALEPALASVRRQALRRRDEARRAAEEAAKRLRLDPTAAEPGLPPAIVGVPYRTMLPIRGGTPPYRVSGVAAKPLADGLTLGSDGAITGTPQASALTQDAGKRRFALEISDAAKGTAQGEAVVPILPPPAITPERLPDAVLDQSYQTELAVSSLTAARWDIIGLPEGLTATPQGNALRLHGIPTMAGAFRLVVTAKQDGLPEQATARRTLTLTVDDGFAPNAVDLPPATAHAPYRTRVGVRGPAAAYRWNPVTAGGLSLAADGTITGTPERAGPLELATRISHPDGRTRDARLTITVNEPPVIAESEPIEVEAGSPVARAIRSEGGSAPIASWRLVSGMLPAGLSLTPDGRLTGATTVAGESTATIACADRWGATAQADVRVTVKPRDPSQQPKDQQQQADQQQQGQQEAGKQGDQQPGKQDQQPGKQDQQGQQADSKQGDGKQPGDQAMAAAGDGKQGKDGKDGKTQEAQTMQLQGQAADRFLDQLNADDRDALRYQLLEGRERAKRPAGGRSW